MDNSKKLRLWEVAALIAICAALCAGTWAQGRQESISANLVRLHVVAVSDDEYEQELKLRVRDAVLEYISPQLREVESSAGAKALILSSLDGIKKAAESAAEGRDVSVSLRRESFPTKQYEGFVLPSGHYDSLRIVLGEGEGHNWWCIVFPPVCLSAVQADEVQAAMNEEEFALITEEEGYALKFRLVELWGEITNALA